MQRVNVALIGGGTVGGGVYQGLQRNGPLMSSRLGIGIAVSRVVVRDPRKKRSVRIPARMLTTDWRSSIDDPKVNLVVELVGGTTTARAITLRALKQGKPVVTANKALLSEHGEELFKTANAAGTNLYYEASVAGGIPIIKVLREGLIGNRFSQIYGILNGTCNYILTRMRQDGLDFAAVLAEAQRLGYAEAEPSLDVDGLDAMHKTGILASLAHGFWVNPKHIFVEGIREITQMDLQFADQLGYTIKLLAVIKGNGALGKAAGSKKSTVQVSVCPTLVPHSHVLASVNDVFNAIYVNGDIVGETLYFGRGAGQDATASAVLSDVAHAALDLKYETKERIPPFVPHEKDGTVVPWGEVISQYYLRLSVLDRPGTMAKIANVFASLKIGISSIIQPEGHEGDIVPLILMLHDADNRTMNRGLEKLSQLTVVKTRPLLIRVEDLE